MNTRTKLIASAVAVATASILATTDAAQPAATSPPTAECSTSSRGQLLNSAPPAELSRAEVAAELADAGLPGDNSDGVTSRSIRYCTVAPDGRPTTASGLLAVPQGRTGQLPLVIYAHSTVVARTAVPAAQAQADGRLVPLFFAASGFAVVAPDYLGLGSSPGTHPYMHAASEASATMDLLTAADRVSSDHDVRLSRTVSVSGHSQGGHAAMAIGRAIEQGGGPWRLVALAPIAGPFDLYGTSIPALLDPARTDQHRASTYLAYLLTSWKSLYHLYTDPREIFAAPYAEQIEKLFDGTRDFTEIQALLPLPAELLRPEAMAMITQRTGRFADALRDNGVCDWAPAAPARLHVGQLDTDVVPANSDACRQQIMARGGTAEVVNLGAVDHVGTAVAALPLIRAWFSQL